MQGCQPYSHLHTEGSNFEVKTRLLVYQFLQQLTVHCVGPLMHLLLIERLDRMLDQNHVVIGHAQRISLRPGRIGELGRGEGGDRYAGFLKENAIVHTARCARASIR